MSAEHHVVYVPGLGDTKKGYDVIIGSWKIYGVVPHVHRVNWMDREENFELKLNKLVSEVRKLLKRKNIVSLIGGSAGGSMVLNAFLEEPEINAVVDITGRLREGENVHPTLEEAALGSPAFKKSVIVFESKEPRMTKEQREKVLTLAPIWDEAVPKGSVPLKGATNKILPSVEHNLTGFLGITLFAPIAIKFVKSKVTRE